MYEKYCGILKMAQTRNKRTRDGENDPSQQNLDAIKKRKLIAKKYTNLSSMWLLRGMRGNHEVQFYDLELWFCQTFESDSCGGNTKPEMAIVKSIEKSLSVSNMISMENPNDIMEYPSIVHTGEKWANPMHTFRMQLPSGIEIVAYGTRTYKCCYQ